MRTTSPLVGALLLWHLLAITLGSLRSPYSPPAPPRSVPPSRLAQALDAVAVVQARLHARLWHIQEPVRPAIDAYLTMTGMAQPWNMFSNPPQYDEYLRVRFYIERARNPHQTRVATELVMPVAREDQLRLFRAYRESYEDKAYSIALQRFYRNRAAHLIAPDTKSSELPNDLAPIGRFYARRFAERGLSQGERIVRIEVWRGAAATPPPGRPVDEAARLARRAVLLEYYQGPVDERFNVPRVPPYHGVDYDADIEWLLEYFEEPS